MKLVQLSDELIQAVFGYLNKRPREEVEVFFRRLEQDIKMIEAEKTKLKQKQESKEPSNSEE